MIILFRKVPIRFLSFFFLAVLSVFLEIMPQALLSQIHPGGVMMSSICGRTWLPNS